MMRAYPSVERRHFDPAERGLKKIGHVGFFKPANAALWPEVIGWLDGE